MEDRFVERALRQNAEKKALELKDAEEITIYNNTVYSGRLEIQVSSECIALLNSGELRLDYKLKNNAGSDFHYSGVASSEPFNFDILESKYSMREQFRRAESYLEHIIRGTEIAIKDQLAKRYHELLRLKGLK